MSLTLLYSVCSLFAVYTQATGGWIESSPTSTVGTCWCISFSTAYMVRRAVHSLTILLFHLIAHHVV